MSVDEKLERGFERLAQAEGNRDMLGAALLAIHGALEDHLRAILAESATLGEEDRAVLERRDTGWSTLTRLAQQHANLRPEHRRAILQINELRQAFAHGEEFGGSYNVLVRYGHLVEALCNRRGLLDSVLQNHERRAAALANPTGWRRLPQFWRDTIRSLAIIGIVAVVLFLIGRALYARVDADLSRLVGSLGVAPTVVAQPTLSVPSPTPTVRARIVRLGDVTGWLHEQPNFDSATLPYPIREGVRVTVLDQQQTVDGVAWQYVSVGGYEGWVPLNNLELDTP
jgi:hypothetical protein